MKDYLGQNISAKGSTFRLANAGMYHALNSFHSHPEVELLYVASGEGTFSIGDRSQRIASGTMILIGSGVPHMLKFESNRYYDYATKHAKPIIPLQLLTLHFDPQKLGREFLELEENSLLKQLLEEAKSGIMIHGEAKAGSLTLLEALQTCPTQGQLPLLLQLWNTVASATTFNQNRPTIQKPFKKIDETRLSMIYLYTMDNFYREIKLRDIAAIVHMVPGAFCNYFRSRTGRSYFDFLIEVRIEHARKLLRETGDSVGSICNESGFSNLSNFNRYFKLQTGSSPLAYRQAQRR